MNSLLEKISSPEDLRPLSADQLKSLAAEIRTRIIRVVSQHGGHLGANLGTVELTIALLRAFQVPEEPVLWDVGHQCYTWKLLTGRQAQFENLRAFGGCSGFPVRGETPFDCFGAGHAGVAISAALGMCAAQPPESTRKIIAVVGDGAIGSGVALEGLNSVRDHGRNLVIILNDNKMAIDQNVGAIAHGLNRIIIGNRYRHFKNLTKAVVRSLPHGPHIERRVRRIEDAVKSLILPGGVFEELGIRYLGPVDGHSMADLERTFAAIRHDDRPVVIHVVTEKGHGYAPAVAAPERFHGVGAFDPDSGEPRSPGQPGFSAAFGAAMLQAAERHPELCAVVAAMGGGVGLKPFAEHFPKRFFDVGMAESHAVTFAAGLAAAGKHPVVAIYATFLQRALDNVFHDVCLNRLPVTLVLDRAGLVEDGPTHHGIFDLGFLLAMPHLSIMLPACEREVAPMLELALNTQAPVLIRYPRGRSGWEDLPEAPEIAPVELGRSVVWKPGNDLAIYAAGAEAVRALRIARNVEERTGKSVKVVNVRFLKPFDEAALQADLLKMPVVTLEDHVAATGLGGIVAQTAAQVHGAKFRSFGFRSSELPAFGNVGDLRRSAGLDAEQLEQALCDWMTQETD